MELEKYSIGVGDRFGMEGKAQVRALQEAETMGVRVVPVWNKSNREHSIIRTNPQDARKEAEEAVQRCGWKHSYYVDADHIGLATVDRFLESSDFFTIDVADYIGKPSPPESIAAFMKAMEQFKGTFNIPGISAPIVVTAKLLESLAQKYLGAIGEAGKVYRHIAEKKRSDAFVPEVSVDESNAPQTPGELLFILAAISREGIPIQTIAPKFSGSFLKGIDYVGEKEQFAKEFEDDLAVIAFAVRTFGLPRNLKLSVHSGSDKFSLYPLMHQAIHKFDAGLHLKTAGTTWLEEVIGLAASGGDGLALVKELYGRALTRYDEMCKPYLSVIEIDKSKLPSSEQVARWSSREYVEALQHNQLSPGYNVNFRQLVHVSFRIAAEMGERYLGLLRDYRTVIESNVTLNIFQRHVLPLFVGKENLSRPRRNTAAAGASV
ncbi:MAG: hypothetical protein HYZ01_10375 [Ignavibacteriales bacterium]|nr:hypothetical protein [Ignavibacteriales bacterium]